MPTVHDAFLTQISLVSRKLKSEAQRRLLQHGVHAGQQFILGCLWDEDGLTPGELAARIQVEKPTITRAVQRMTTAGLIRCGSDERDRRRIRVWLTPKGDRLRHDLPRVMGELQDDALALLNEDEKGALVELLAQVNRALEKCTDGAHDSPPAVDDESLRSLPE